MKNSGGRDAKPRAGDYFQLGGKTVLVAEVVDGTVRFRLRDGSQMSLSLEVWWLACPVLTAGAPMSPRETASGGGVIVFPARRREGVEGEVTTTVGTAETVDLFARRGARRKDTEAVAGPVIPFDTDDPEFARGFEAGCVWFHLADSPQFMSGLFHRLNRTMLERIADGRGYAVEFRNTEDIQWVQAFFTRRSGPSVG